MNEKKREIGIDYLKAFAILTIVLRHSITYCNMEYKPNIILNVIYSFHVPLFIFISGYLTFSSFHLNEKLNKFEYLKKRVLILFIPYLTWLFVYTLVENYKNIISGDYTFVIKTIYSIIVSPDNGSLWFLWILLLCNVIFFYLQKTSHFYRYSILLVAVMYLLINYNHWFSYFGIGLFRWYYLFFIAGYFYNDKQVSKKFNIYWFLFTLFVLLISEYVWNNNELVFVKELENLQFEIVRYTVAFSAILVLFKLCQFMSIENSFVNWVSKNTLGIYAIHFLWIFFLINVFTILVVKLDTAFMMSIVFCLTTIMSIVSIIYIKKISKVSVLFLGR